MQKSNLVRALNALLLTALLLVGVGLVWEFATQHYWSGLADAIIPLEAAPEEKVEAILAWMGRWPARASVDEASGQPQDRIATSRGLHYLSDCGAATNIVLNLSASSGFRARRLLLLGDDGGTMHVVTEVQTGQRWIVVDALNRAVLRGENGNALTREELADPEVFREAVAVVPGYKPEHTFRHTAHIRAEKIPILGGVLRGVLNRILPGWEGWVAESLVFDRRSRLFTMSAALLFTAAALGRAFAGWRLRRKSS